MPSKEKRLVNQDFKDLFRVFNEYKVRYLVVGAYAVIYYAEPRYTKDLDIWVEPSLENARLVWKALTAFGAPLEEVTLEDLCNPELVYQIGMAPNRIDIMMNIPGVEFSSAYERKVESTYGEESIKIIAIDDLIKAKRTVDREQDRLDVKSLEQVKSMKK
jgi:hypothetical protein